MRSPTSPPHPTGADALAAVLRQSAAQQGLGRTERRGLVAGVLAAHLLGAWGLMQVDAVRVAVQDALPLQVDWIAPPSPTPHPAPPPPAPRPITPTQRPVIAAPANPVMPAPSFTAPAQDAPVAPPAAVPVVAAAPAPAPASAPAPTPPRQIPASAVRYLVPPAQVYPLASRRLQEQGTVLLRLVVDVNGLPQRVSVHQSSGHPRLDEQAVQAMRAARFKPHTDNGVPVEWTAIAPLAYELD